MTRHGEESAHVSQRPIVRPGGPANKPIELLDGANLLYLLSEHAGIDAKIMPPEDWRDPAADAPEY